MPDTNQPRPRGGIRAVNVALVLLAAVVFTACASPLVHDTQPAAEPLPLLTQEDERLAARAVGAIGGAAGLPSMPDEARDADDGAWRGETATTRVDDALIVRTASLELEVEDVAVVLVDARDAIAALGGYVSASDEYDQGDHRWASVTYRVPVVRFTDAIDTLRGLSVRVARESTQSHEVTAQVVDLDARIANLRASEEALSKIMDRSGRMEDVLAVQVRLEDVRGQIERLEAQRANLADQAALSTLSVAWFTPVAAVTVAQEGWSIAAEVDAALAQTVGALQGAVSLGVWFAFVALPVLGIPLLVAVALALWLRRRLRPASA